MQIKSRRTGREMETSTRELNEFHGSHSSRQCEIETTTLTDTQPSRVCAVTQSGRCTSFTRVCLIKWTKRRRQWPADRYTAKWLQEITFWRNETEFKKSLECANYWPRCCASEIRVAPQTATTSIHTARMRTQHERILNKCSCSSYPSL